MGRITLSQNHKRSVSSALYVLEEIVDDLEHIITRSAESITVGWTRNISDDQMQKILVAIQEVRHEIKHLMERYELPRQSRYLDRVINAGRAKMWEILCDTTSYKLKGYGKFPAGLQKEFDADMDRLMEKVRKVGRDDA